VKPAALIATRGWDPEEWADHIRPHLPGRTILTTDRRSRFSGEEQALADVHYALVWKAQQELMDRLPNLRAIFSLGAGVDHLFALPRLPSVPLVRIVDHDLTARMTQYVVWQVLDHLRRGPIYRRQQREHLWREPNNPRPQDVTIGLMGLGVMGESAAEMLLRFGFVLRGWSRGLRTLKGVETFAGRDGLTPFLAGTDVAVCLLPLTPETQGILDLKLIRSLRRSGPLGGAVIINAGRGGLQVEEDIAKALTEGALAGASLDVFNQEPLSPDSPLWNLDNVTITPHVAAVSNPETLAIQIAQQIEAFERGEPLRNRVDPRRGY
jgi:glyoxylate/hydroxypyruvate reductase A